MDLTSVVRDFVGDGEPPAADSGWSPFLLHLRLACGTRCVARAYASRYVYLWRRAPGPRRELTLIAAHDTRARSAPPDAAGIAGVAAAALTLSGRAASAALLDVEAEWASNGHVTRDENDTAGAWVSLMLSLCGPAGGPF